MSLVGKLDEVELPELLQAIADSQKTGKLKLTRRDREGIIVFREGMIVYAASSSARQTLGNLLLCEQSIDNAQLTTALELQHLSQQEQRLGTILREMDAVDEETLERIVHRQTEKVILEFMSWKSGFFAIRLWRSRGRRRGLPDQGRPPDRQRSLRPRGPFGGGRSRGAG